MSFPVATTKFGGSLHYRFAAQAVERSADRLVLFSPAGTPCDSYRGRLAFPLHELWVNWRNRDWNLIVQWTADWRPHCEYVNIGLPSTWDDGTLRFVDLDLDVLRHPDGGVALDDAAEFAENQLRYAYPPHVIARAEAAAATVLALARAGSSPLDGRLYAWRPGQALNHLDTRPP
ncbi:MAG: DUF402 domain-containing protein [Actinomycetota bacterium]|nr:DUF402 domain-containing protein [Actinomycetota bacterium]